MTARSFTFPAFCPAHPDAGLDVVATEAPRPETGSVARVHTRCADCGLPWTFTATCVPTKDHVAEAHGIAVLHPRGGVAA